MVTWPIRHHKSFIWLVVTWEAQMGQLLIFGYRKLDTVGKSKEGGQYLWYTNIKNRQEAKLQRQNMRKTSIQAYFSHISLPRGPRGDNPGLGFPLDTLLSEHSWHFWAALKWHPLGLSQSGDGRPAQPCHPQPLPCPLDLWCHSSVQTFTHASFSVIFFHMGDLGTKGLPKLVCLPWFCFRLEKINCPHVKIS